MISFNEFCQQKNAVNEGILSNIKKSVTNFFRKVKNKVYPTICYFFKGKAYEGNSITTIGAILQSGAVKGVTFGSGIETSELDASPLDIEIKPYDSSEDGLMLKNLKYLAKKSNELNDSYQYDSYRSDYVSEGYKAPDDKRASDYGYSMNTGADSSDADGHSASILDKTPKQLKRLINDEIVNMHYAKTGGSAKKSKKPLFIWGIPGIGKTNIPHTIIQEWNNVKHKRADSKSIITYTPTKNENGKNYIEEDASSEAFKKGMIHINCQDITSESFGIPGYRKVAMQNMGSDYDSNYRLKQAIQNSVSNKQAIAVKKPVPYVKDGVHQRDGEGNLMYKHELERVETSGGEELAMQQMVNAPATWLPVYPTTGIAEIDNALREKANSVVYVDYSDDNKIKTCKCGGILFFDEVLRTSDPGVLDTLMTLAQQRVWNGYNLGDMWTILCASNRPSDDVAVKQVWQSKGSFAFSQRFRHISLVPNLDEWLEYVENKLPEHFDLIEGFFDNKPSYFHENPDMSDVQDFTKTVSASPRSWMDAFNDTTHIAKQVKNDVEGYYDDEWKGKPNDETWYATYLNDRERFEEYFYENIGGSAAKEFLRYLDDNVKVANTINPIDYLTIDPQEGYKGGAIDESNTVEVCTNILSKTMKMACDEYTMFKNTIRKSFIGKNAKYYDKNGGVVDADSDKARFTDCGLNMIATLINKSNIESNSLRQATLNCLGRYLDKTTLETICRDVDNTFSKGELKYRSKSTDKFGKNADDVIDFIKIFVGCVFAYSNDALLTRVHK